MAKKKKKYYVVWEGKKPGIYSNWNECLEQLKGYSKPVFKAFDRYDVAEKAFMSEPDKYFEDNYVEPGLFDMERKEKIKPSGTIEKPVTNALAVDAACSGNPGVMEYRGVELATGKEIFRKGPFPLATNNIGEFLAIVHALALLKKQNSLLPVYSDSKTAISWVERKNVRTNLERNEKTEEIYKIIERAVNWLENNSYENKILKWDTENWGEIPADFGRK